jgi:hypothetical protein
MACTSPEHVVPATVELMIARQTGLGIARSRDRQRRGGVGLLGELVERDLDPESSLLIATRIFSVECVGSDGGSVTAGAGPCRWTAAGVGSRVRFRKVTSHSRDAGFDRRAACPGYQ